MLIKPILLSAALAAGFMPLTSTPPIKMGLWEQNSQTDMSGASIPAMLGHRNIKLRLCITPDAWAKSFANSNNKNCERKNESLTGGHYTADVTCQRMSGHVDINFTTQEAAHGTVDMSMAEAGMTVHSVSDMHFVSSDCGAVSPDKPEIIK